MIIGCDIELTIDELFQLTPFSGLSFSPRYKAAPFAAKLDPELYELLVLVDAIRAGKTRERNYA